MPENIDCENQGKTPCPPPAGQGAENASSHCGQCSAGSRPKPAVGGHGCKAHMPPARSLAESLIPFMFLVGVLVFGLLFLGKPRKAPEPETIRLTPPAAGVEDVAPKAPER